MSDVSISNTMIVILICHFAVLIIGYKMRKTMVLISYINAVMVIGIFVFWTINSLPIKQPNFEFRELFVIGLEVCILIFALYSIIGFYNKTLVKAVNYIGFGFHLLATTGMLYYLATFKLNRLF